MTAAEREHEEPPKPPRIGLLIAVMLELALLAVLVAERSYPGLAIVVAYAWFSATWSVFERMLRGDM